MILLRGGPHSSRGIRIPLLLWFLVVVWGCCGRYSARTVDAFAPLQQVLSTTTGRASGGLHRCLAFGGHRTRTSSSELWATIYAPSSWDEGSGLAYRYDDEGEADHIAAGDGVSSTLAALLSKRGGDGARAALARLAAAFGPRGHHLDLRHIEHVEVRAVDATHLDLEAVLCERDGCVTVAVPVHFPRPCSSHDGNVGALEECVISNVDELDGQATELLLALDWREEHHEEVATAQRELRALRDTDDLHFPEWWMPAPAGDAGDALRTEGESLRRLLNEAEFADDVRDLAGQALMDTGNDAYDDWTVQRASVSAVGPAGFLLRAALEEIVLFDAAPRTQLLEIPVPFDKAVGTADDLRSAVLNAVSGASGYSDL